jgi:CheY-like chemotaxis protein
MIPDSSEKIILVVEDNPVNLKLVKALLEIGKYNVITAYDGEGALQVLVDHIPDLILMDIQLPGIDGIETTRRIKADPRLKGIPVIALTACVLEDEKSDICSICDGYIPKPIDTRQFLTTISDIIG